MMNLTETITRTRSSDEVALNRFGTLGVIIACLAAIFILTISGCSGTSAHAVDPPRAATRWSLPSTTGKAAPI